jgi:uncharacterized membrane protein YfcA
MNFISAIDPLFAISGFLVGFLVGLTGVGGGSLMTPLLILAFGVQPVTAVGTDLLYAAITKSGGTLVHAFNKTVEWRIVGRMALGSVPGAALTMLVLYLLDIHSGKANEVVTKALATALLLTSVVLIFRKVLLRRLGDRLAALSQMRVRNMTILTGFVLGVIVSISSVGAGALGVTVLILLYPNLPVVRIAGSDIVHAVPLTFVAGMGHWALGSVDFGMLGSLLTGSIPGIIIGSLIAPRVHDDILRILLACTLILVATKLLLA